MGDPLIVATCPSSHLLPIVVWVPELPSAHFTSLLRNYYMRHSSSMYACETLQLILRFNAIEVPKLEEG